MRILVQDFSGHPFQVQLSRELAARGHEVLHTYCPDYVSGQGALRVHAGDPPTLRIQPVAIGEPFNKYHPLRRFLQEIRYGRRLAAQVRAESPDVVVSCNEPLLSKFVLGLSCRRHRQRWVFWLQDLYSVAMRRELVARVGRIGGLVGDVLIRMEGWLLASSSAAVLITPAFEDWMAERNVAPPLVEVIPNWAPLDEILYFPSRQNWFATHLGIGTAPVALYAGTLGRKHNAQVLTEVAAEIAAAGAHVVVISEGEAADALATEARRIENLHVLPFQPWADLPEILASANCLLVILDEAAGAFSVPSKVLTYFCAGRPIVASVPEANLAAAVLTDTGAGIVVAPDDVHSLAKEVARVLADPDLATQMGGRARKHAVEAFDIDRIADRFEAVLIAVSRCDPRRS